MGLLGRRGGGGGGQLFKSTNDSYAALLAFMEGFQERGNELADFEEKVFLRESVEGHCEASDSSNWRMSWEC